MFSKLPIGVSTLQEVGILPTWVYCLPLGELRGCFVVENWDFLVLDRCSSPRGTEIRLGEGMNLL